MSLFGSWTVTPILAQSGKFWFPEQASNFAPGLDWNYLFIYWTCVVFFVIIIGAMLYFMYRFRRRHEHEVPAKSTTHNNTLEMLWSIIPAFLVVYIFWIGFRGYMDMKTIPEENVFPIEVEASKWKWEFLYDGGKTVVAGQSISDSAWQEARKASGGNLSEMEASVLKGLPEMHIPFESEENAPTVVLTMRSIDVLHSFSVPAFRIKQDVVPGRYTKVWFRPNRKGEFTIQCMEYCGDRHSEMWAKVVVESPEEFEAWISDQRDPFKKVRKRLVAEKGEEGLRDEELIVEVGKDLFYTRGCTQCHDATSSERDPAKLPNKGPGFVGNFGTKVQFQDGTEGVVDEAYLRQSILNPQAKIRRGFTGVSMPMQNLKSSDDKMQDEVGAIVEFIKSLKESDGKE